VSGRTTPRGSAGVPSAGQGTPARHSVVHRPPPRDLGLLVVGVIAISTSGPLIAATAAPAIAIAFWRNAFGTLAIAPFALVRQPSEMRSLVRREWLLILGAGVVLALHFVTWVPSLRYTSVASSTAMVATQPVWSALIARVQGRRVAARVWAGMFVAFVGVLLLTGVDFSLEPRALVGDFLALVGAVFAAAYVSLGSAVRRTVTTTTYTFLCYGFCAVLLLVVCLVGGLQLRGYSSDTWLKLLALTAGAQLLGHSVFNVVLRSTSPTVVSLAILFEMPGATIIAAAWLGQAPPLAVYPAAALLLLGTAVVVSSQGVETIDVPPS
jgi:drug/metabolite transporter (DMT)-like permease